MKKKMTPILAIVLLILSLIFAFPGEDKPLPDPADEILTESGETQDTVTDIPDLTESMPEQTTANTDDTPQDPDCGEEPALDPDASYTTKEDVALYIYLYGCLPQNFITKNEARELGWEGGGLEPFAPGMCIGGDRFGNYEGILPKKNGRQYYECDIDFDGTYRNGKRIVFSNDGLIFYTEDHYETFEEIKE